MNCKLFICCLFESEADLEVKTFCWSLVVSSISLLISLSTLIYVVHQSV